MKKKLTMTIILAAVLTAFTFSLGCDDDEKKASCTTDDAEKCGEEFATCSTSLDASAPTYTDDLTKCTKAVCSCLNDKGCDIKSYKCE